MRDSEALTRTTIEAIWRIEAARLIGGLGRFVRDVDRAQDLAHANQGRTVRNVIE